MRMLASEMAGAVLAPRVSDHGKERCDPLADWVPVPVCVVAPDGRLRYGNPAWKAATASCAAAQDWADWTQAIHEDDRALLSSVFHEALSRGERFEIELRLRSADGEYRWWSFLAAPRYDTNGDIDGYVGVCRDATERRHVRETLHDLSAKLVAAQEAERGHIARELHDDLGQQVALLCSRLETLAHRRLSRESVRAGLAEACTTLQELAVSLHNLSHALHPAKFKLVGLERTLEGLCRETAREGSVPIRFEAGRIPADVPEESALCVYRVTQESLRNAVKHSGARHVHVRLLATPSQLTLRVTDDGSGFDPVAAVFTGLGLLTMRERVELLGGRLRIDTAPARGTTIEAVVPMKRSAGAEPTGAPAGAARR